MLAVLPNDFNDAHLKHFIHAWNLVKHLDNILHRLVHRTVREEHKCVAFTGSV